MGGVVGQLAVVFCCSGCRGSVVASALAFHPPHPPIYDIINEKGIYKFRIDETIIELQTEMITTATGTRIPLICIRSKNAKYTFLFSHGNATDIGAMLSFYLSLSKALDVNVVAYDYTGYGMSTDKPGGHINPTEEQVYKDIDAVFDWCKYNLTPDPHKNLIIYGQSIGSGPSCYIASKQRVAGKKLFS